MANPLPFKKLTADTYAATFASTCTPRQTRRGLLLTGTCPRCGDRMDFPVPTGIFLRPASAVPVDRSEPVMCTCAIAHPGTPQDDEGCGAYWNVEIAESAP